MNRTDRLVLFVSAVLVGVVALRAVVDAVAVIAGPGIALGAGYGLYRIYQTGKISLLRGKEEEKRL